MLASECKFGCKDGCRQINEGINPREGGWREDGGEGGLILSAESSLGLPFSAELVVDNRG